MFPAPQKKEQQIDKLNFQKSNKIRLFSVLQNMRG